MVNINIHLPDDLHKKLKLHALNKDSSLKALILNSLEKATKKVKLPRKGKQ